MPGRTRTLDLRTGLVGTIRDGSGNLIATSNQYPQGPITTTTDVTGNRFGVNPFDLNYQYKSGGVLNGKRLNVSMTAFDRTFYDYPMACTSEFIPDPHSYYPMSAFRTSELAWKLLAETNPGDAHVSVPQFLGELKDLPSLVRGWGRSAIRDVAQSHLVYRWAYLPFLSDLKKLLTITEAVNNRFKDLERLRKGVKLGRRKRLDGGQKSIVGSPFLAHSQEMTINGRWRIQVSEEVWGTVQWHAPSWSWTRTASDEALLREAKKATLGLNSWGAVATAWELLPWSWLIDWFSNVGSMIQACNNAFDLVYRNICIMQKTVLNQTFELTTALHPRNAGITYSPHLRQRIRKLRYPNPLLLPFPTFRLPVLTDSKLSIIAALAALRLPQSRKQSYLGIGS